MSRIPESEWPYETRSFDAPAGRMAYVDEGQGVPLVLVHGTPSCSTEWRHVMRRLLPARRVIAMDHLGFGQSAPLPPAEKGADAPGSFAWHRSNLRPFLEQVPGPKFDLVVHDVGGPIALPLVPALGARVRSLTIVQSWLWDLGLEPSFDKSRALMGGRLMRWLYLSWNFSPKMMVKLAWGKRLPLTKALHHEFIDQFPTRESRAPLWGFVRAIVDEGASASLQAEPARLAAASVPTTVVWGRADGMVKPLHLDQWKKVLPNARYVELADVGHFPQIEAPAEVAAALPR